MDFHLLNVRTASFLLVFILFFSCLGAHALPPWLQRGGAQEEQEEEILKMPDFEIAHEEEIRPRYHSEPERTKGPFLWIFIGFIASAFITSL